MSDVLYAPRAEKTKAPAGKSGAFRGAHHGEEVNASDLIRPLAGRQRPDA